MSDLATAALSQMGTLVTDYADIWIIPIGICVVGLVLTVVVNALRGR